MTRTTVGWVVLAVAIGAGGAAGQGPAPKAKGVPGPIVAAGASFAEPSGWTRVQPARSSTIGWFVNPGATSANAQRMIVIDFGRPADRDARKAAEGLARQWGGTVLEKPIALDGAPGYLVVAENRGPGLKPAVGIVVHRAGRAYLIMGGAVPGDSVANEVEEVRRGWKWVNAPR
jgi:hypothetical protein